MADYKYLGMTAYIVDSPEVDEKFAILTEAIDVLQFVTQTVAIENIEATYQHVLASKAFAYLYENDTVCYPKEYELPENTPVSYQNPQIERVVVKGKALVRFYLPTCAKREESLHAFIYEALIPTLTALFEGALLHIKTREAYEYETFTAARERVVL